MLAFDIETGPLPDERLKELLPQFVADDHVKPVGEFDESAVKIGGLKDQAKIDSKINTARAAHRTALLNYSSDVKAARLAHFDNFKSKAALSPLTGEVLAIGYGNPGKTGREIRIDVVGETHPGLVDGVKMSESLDDEASLLSRFWLRFLDASGESTVGFNILGFDLPFLVRRSWVNGIDVPATVKEGRYWHRLFVDLLEVWQCGQRGNPPVLDNKLNTICQALGIEGKPDDGTTGADFARLLTEDRERAISYLAGDVRMTLDLAEVLQVL